MNQKSTEELFAITLKNDAKFEEKLTFASKNDMRNLAKIDSTLSSVDSKRITELKNYRGVIYHYTEG